MLGKIVVVVLQQVGQETGLQSSQFILLYCLVLANKLHGLLQGADNII